MSLDVDVVLWGNTIVPIVHIYRYRHGVYGRTSFVPLEDVVPPIVLGIEWNVWWLQLVRLRGRTC
jgi:hypothetical protein